MNRDLMISELIRDEGVRLHWRSKLPCLLDAAREDTDSCILWPYNKNQKGYGRIKIMETYYSVHRVAYQALLGEIPPGMQVLHRCDVPSCFNPSHLFIGNNDDNVADKISKGRQRNPIPMPGSSHPSSRLTEEQVTEMRRLYSLGGISTSCLAKRFGIAQSVAWRIIARKSWKHI